MSEMKKKIILDACCGGRMMWFNKKHPSVLYIDKFPRGKGTVAARPNFECKPDKVMDFRDMKLKDKSFKLVVFDPPHFTTLTPSSWMYKKYGGLDKETWKDDIKKGSDECWRVLENNGVLIFKWSVDVGHPRRSITVSDILKVVGRDPLFGHPSGKQGNTMWMCFMKLPINN
jgi:hypothetical protein